jgi:tRNA pseudouridine38-40 synthase
MDGPALTRALNGLLPASVRVLSAQPVPAAFHARFDSQVKTYRYRFWNDAVMSPFERHYAWHIPAPRLDHEAMSAAAMRLNGRRDFAAFRAAGSDTRGTERVVFSSSVRRSGPLIVYEIAGAGFLRHMVRNIAGTLVDVGRGRHGPQWVDDVLASRDRGRAGATAPARGLFLVSVGYTRARPNLAAEP